MTDLQLSPQRASDEPQPPMSPATSVQEFLDHDARPVPPVLRYSINEDLGSEPLDVERFISREFHDRESTFERDRERDAHLSVLGHRVLRFSYRQVFERWHVVEAAVRGGVTAAGRPRPRRR